MYFYAFYMYFMGFFCLNFQVKQHYKSTQEAAVDTVDASCSLPPRNRAGLAKVYDVFENQTAKKGKPCQTL